MQERIMNVLRRIEGGIQTSCDGIAWPLDVVTCVLEAASHNRWIILGGDVLTQKLKHTYDNWYYQPNPHMPLAENVANSIQKASNFISEYVKTNGKSHLFVLVLSETYVDGYVS